MERDDYLALLRQQDLEVILKELRVAVEELAERGRDVWDAPRLIAEAEEALAGGDLEGAEACARMALEQIEDPDEDA